MVALLPAVVSARPFVSEADEGCSARAGANGRAARRELDASPPQHASTTAAALRLGSCKSWPRDERREMSRTTDTEPAATGEAILRARLRGLVREQPWLAVAAAAATGGALGGIWFSRAARLVFAAATGFVAHELWHREGQLSVSDIVTKLSGDAKPPDEARRPSDRTATAATR
jgi:ElaB/YqjD/DUF883 family membrane-anchored ribosome-binding protein